MKRLSFAAISLAIASFILLFSPQDAQAATITVTSPGDSGAGTLRQAILNAASGDTINFSLPSGTTVITLTSAELLTNKNLTISGPGPSLLRVQRSTAGGTPNFRIFEIDGAGNVTISGLTIANGSGSGGGIFNESSGTVTIAGCVISGNSAGAGGTGGGIFNAGTTMTITNCTLSGNSNPDSEGGGISTYTGSMTTITNSTISGNSAGYGGGGVDNSGTLATTSSTISGNSANQNGGGGIRNESTGSVYARNTIIARNTSPGAANDFQGILISQGYNLIGNTSGTAITGDTTGNQLNVDPLLGPLQDNGGPTQTQALLSGSPAIDKGTSSGSTADQRGFPRPIDNSRIPNAMGGDAGDIGAYEDQTVCEAVVTNNNDSGAGSLRDAIANVCVNGTITFSGTVVSSINLTSGELVIPRPMTITGPGANQMTVQRSASASTNFSIFHISAGGYATISGLTITKGNPNHLGGGFYVDNASTLFLESCAVTNNSAQSSGALMSNGGGIATGGIGTPSVVIISSTISGNSATQDGGGIAAGSLTLDTSTVSGNTATRYGGGIAVAGTTNITNSTIANNSALSTGGGLRGNGSSITSSNSIFARNAASITDPDFSGTLTSHGYNLIGNNTGTVITGTTTGNQLNVNPLLGPLQDNGGPTNTCALLTGSPAIDQGQPYGITLADQRGVNRPYDFPSIPNAGNGSDIGAFESAMVIPTSAVSRKTQGAGMYDINLPLTGSPGVECRSAGATNDYQIVVVFPSAVTLGSVAMTSGIGMVSSVTGNGTTMLTVNFTGVTNAQRMAVTLSNVNIGAAIGDVVIPMAILVGDTNGNGSVNSSDVSQTKLQSGQAVTNSNFREDVNANGTINSSDVSLVKLKSGTALP